jgi:hypothetical protein
MTRKAGVRPAGIGYETASYQADLPANDVGHHVPQASKPGRYEYEHPDIFPKVAFIESALFSHVFWQSPPRVECEYPTLFWGAMAVP